MTYTPDSAGRVVSAVDGNGTSYVTSASYNPNGSIHGLLNGSTPALNSNFQYNPRLQMCRMTTLTTGTMPTSCTDTQNIGNVMDRGYDFHAGNGIAGSGTDSGNVFAITNYRDANRSQTFTYDALNRITSGQSSASTGAYSWGENYSIDAWGNLQISPMAGKANGGTFQLSGNMQNRPTGLAYDAAGNLMSNLSATYTYDQENRLSSTAGMTYTYDGNGERVLKSNTSTGAAVKRYWSMGGNPLAEGDGTGNLTAEYIYFGSKRIARIALPANTVHYYLTDHLGSTSIVANSAGAVEEESDYYPFGTEVVVTGPGLNDYKFTGKERDAESGLDQMGARYYSSAMGRFTSPDPLFIAAHRLPDPQMWNLYHYGRNNPLRFTDSTGLDVKLDCSQVSGQQCGQTVDQLNSCKDAQFKVTRDDKLGLLKPDGKVDASKLSKGESALYNAITDTQHHATLEVINQSDKVAFGEFEGNGHNKVDASDMRLLNAASPQAAGETIAHEALEAYGSSFGDGANFSLWHGYANQFFGQVTNGPENYAFSNRGNYYTQDWNFNRIGVGLDVKTVITPQPANSLPRAYTPGTIVDIQPANH